MTPVFPIEILCDSPVRAAEAEHYAQTLGVLALNQPLAEAQYQLVFTPEETYLLPKGSQAHGRIQVDFCAGGVAHRRRFGGGRGQMIAKAVGVGAHFKPQVLDATAGLGGDAFVLACLGCSVTLLERSPIAHALLSDGLRRAAAFAAQEDQELAEIVGRMQLLKGDSIAWLQKQSAPVADVIYLDPMFPERQKKAAVKKNMQALHVVVGQDEDEAELMGAAEQRARFRLVVKRSRLAPQISATRPSYQLQGKACRYDIYTYRALPSGRPSA